MKKTTNKSWFSALLILTSLASSCTAFSIPTAQPRSPACSYRLAGATTVNQGSIHLYLLRGGDDKGSHTGDGTIFSSQQQQYQLSGMVGAPLIKAVIGSFFAIVKVIAREIKTLTFHQKILFAGTFVLGFGLGRVRPFWKRYTEVNEIPTSLFGQQAPALRGRAVSVSDGDTIRFLHQPTRFHPDKLRKGEKASTMALPIRLCTIDTPETKKFGKPGQPYGQEAKEHLTSMLENKVVRIRLLQKDQYGRAVAEVFTSRFPFLLPRKYMDAQMLNQGLAEVYTGAGAVYGPLGIDEYIALQEKAKKAKKGIWSLKKRESAAEYKKRTN